MPRYRVLKDGEVVNRIEWCGHAKYDPGEGCTLELDPDPDASPKRVKTKPLPHPDESDPVSEALVLEREENERLRAENEELKEKLAATQLPPNPAETKLADYIPAEISALMEPGETFTMARKRLSELLNVEKAELRLKRAAGSASDDDLKREADVDRLQGLFSKLGEI